MMDQSVVLKATVFENWAVGKYAHLSIKLMRLLGVVVVLVSFVPVPVEDAIA
jgi:hypothetical protein